MDEKSPKKLIKSTKNVEKIISMRFRVYSAPKASQNIQHLRLIKNISKWKILESQKTYSAPAETEITSLMMMTPIMTSS